MIAQPGFGQDVRQSKDQSNFSIPHMEFSDLGDPRVTRASAGSQTSPGGDDVHFHRHTTETRELYGQMFSELGIPKIRSLPVGIPSQPSSASRTLAVDSGAANHRPISPVSRGLDISASILSPPQTKASYPGRPSSPVGLFGTPGGSQPASSSLHLMHGIAGQCILSVDMFSKEQLNAIFNLAQTFRLCVQKERSLDHILKVHSFTTFSSTCC